MNSNSIFSNRQEFSFSSLISKDLIDYLCGFCSLEAYSHNDLEIESGFFSLFIRILLVVSEALLMLASFTQELEE